MADSIKARNLGDEYQILFFWLKASDMLNDYSNIDKISYEDSEIRSLDDVVVSYKKPIRDMSGKPIYKEYYQVKYHVDYRDNITADNLMDPKFINASKYSFLEKVKEALPILNKSNQTGVAILVTPWSIHPDDDLAKLKIIDTKAGNFREENLFDGKKKSFVAKLRNKLKAHLGVTQDAELGEILKPIRIWGGFSQYEMLVRNLNVQFSSVGLKPFDMSQRINPYVSLLQRLFQEGITTFNKEELINICKEEGLWSGHNIMKAEENPVGIRSFLRRAENMENDTSAMTCLLDYFNGRYLKDKYRWDEEVKGATESFIREHLNEGHSYCIYLDTHSSVAFTAGFFLDSKSGVKVVPIQKGLSGREIWRPNSNVSKEQYTFWKVEHEIINENGNDIVIVIEMTHHAIDDVEEFISSNDLSVKAIIRFHFEDGPSFSSIQDGIHARYLANDISLKLNRLSKEDKKRRYHIFGSGPNGFWFFLGQLSRSFGLVTLYEYDFEISKEYYETINLP
ncbi:SAVED domain-containing protein [Rossellomorea marisflavi]|uniref:SAVED domain-containing protein n=1 Tax=Rossellomorea marisflavi TaxID=189381 RepID=UPI0027A42619|nr:SAVED domain-containing protein [Rossellomorea marisflavi]UTE72808.1 SAVED domain-containing protein [Rossellomorea marisflavi]